MTLETISRFRDALEAIILLYGMGTLVMGIIKCLRTKNRAEVAMAVSVMLSLVEAIYVFDILSAINELNAARMVMVALTGFVILVQALHFLNLRSQLAKYRASLFSAA